MPYRWEVGGAGELGVLIEHVLGGGAQHDEHVYHPALRDPVGVSLGQLLTATTHHVRYLGQEVLK
ncbi:hypothetical protein DPMN_094364 [Dreissena polymorpha]|uniref:Uncharacterized protein n=1 Tax=Dreissena polymorpha TaxID=45954 RepID=A0A9D4L7A8_DREPO|nr:hypothetical protein DPMN_094364 [Dreissena polymorpha]